MAGAAPSNANDASTYAGTPRLWLNFIVASPAWVAVPPGPEMGTAASLPSAPQACAPCGRTAMPLLLPCHDSCPTPFAPRAEWTLIACRGFDPPCIPQRSHAPDCRYSRPTNQ